MVVVLRRSPAVALTYDGTNVRAYVNGALTAHRRERDTSHHEWKLNDATVQLGVMLPSGSALTFQLKTDATGQSDVSFAVPDSGLYQFKVRKVSHPTRTYDASLNIETIDASASEIRSTPHLTLRGRTS
jgi:hypothetical protein